MKSKEQQILLAARKELRLLIKDYTNDNDFSHGVRLAVDFVRSAMRRASAKATKAEAKGWQK